MRAAWLLAAAVHSMGSATAAPPSPEIAGYLGYRSGAEVADGDADPAPTFGLSYTWWVRQDGWLELLYDRQTLEFDPFDLHVDYLQFAGGYEPPGEGLRPYVTLAAGLSWYGADPGSVNDALGLSGSIAAGFKTSLGKKTLLRLEARGFATTTTSSTAVVCGPGCAFAFSGEGWGQLGVRAGIAYRLGPR